MSEFETDEGAKIMPPRCAIYGGPGIGKTTLAGNCDGIIFADLERGSMTLNVARNKNHIDTWEKLLEMTSFLANRPHKYKAFAIDTLDKMEQLIHEYLVRTVKIKGKPIERLDDIGGGWGKGHEAVVEEARKLCAHLEMMWTRGMSYILIAHSKLDTVPNNSGADYQKHTLAIHKKLTGMFFAACDMVLYAHSPVVVKKDGLYDGKRERAIGGDVRYLQTRDSSSWIAKNRYGLKPRMAMSWEDLMAGVAVGNSPDTLRSVIQERLAKINDPEITAKAMVRVTEAANNTGLLITIIGKLDANIQKAQEAMEAAIEAQQTPSAATAS